MVTENNMTARVSNSEAEFNSFTPHIVFNRHIYERSEVNWNTSNIYRRFPLAIPRVLSLKEGVSTHFKHPLRQQSLFCPTFFTLALTMAGGGI